MPEKKISAFSAKVIATIKKIPHGKVATYGQIAALAGKEHASRGVAWLLNSSSKKYKLPWHRVINSRGKISFPVQSAYFFRQIKRLEQEGIEVDNRTGEVDMKTYQWKKK
jgi:methylated-DNA-protein-cysteine methyltransferase-like protein